MIRVLVMIAVAGFVLALVTISTAFAIGGPDFISRHGWELAGRDDWDWDWDDNDHERWEGRCALRLPETRMGAQLAFAGREARGELGRAVARLADLVAAAP